MRLRSVALVSAAVAAAGSAIAYPFLGDTVPMHWNVHGQADGWASKNAAAAFGPLLVLGLWGLFEITARIDPRRPGLQHGGREAIYKAILPFMAALHLAVLALGAGVIHDGTRLVFGLVGALLVALGNYLGKVKPNWFAGIRTPWTLSNDEVWRRTNRLGGRTFVLAGLTTIALAFATSGEVLATGTLVLVGIAALVPAVYSYAIHRQLAAHR